MVIVTQFHIELDRPVYHAGDTLSGHVVLVLNKPKKDQGVSVQLKGKAKAEWRRAKHRVRDEELFFDKKIQLWPVSDDFELPAGTHILPFSCPLPANLPSTFKGKHGKIYYKVKAIMEGTCIIFDNWAEKQFEVIATVDLNGNPPARLPRSGYVQGDTILITAEVNNQSNQSLCMSTVVQQVVTYHITNIIAGKRSEKGELARLEKKTIPPRKSRTWVEVRLQLPSSVPPTDLGDVCRIISIQYYLKVTVEPGGLRIKFPIIMGTIPLRPAVAQLD